VLVPIASHTLSNRPIVLPDSGEVRIGIVAARDVSANFDMHSLASLLHGDQVRVRRSAHKVRFLHPRGWSYYATCGASCAGTKAWSERLRAPRCSNADAAPPALRDVVIVERARSSSTSTAASRC
jgi:hypothetical protein